MHEGLVLRIDAKVVTIEVVGKTLMATIRGRLFDQLKAHERRPVAVGDRVRVKLDAEQATIEEVLPRKTRLSRLAAREENKEQVIVANVDQVFMVSALRKPAPFQPLIDRIMVAAHHHEITPILILNKADLDKKNEREKWISLYTEIGYKVIVTSAKTAVGLDQFQEQLDGRISALAGPSGGGKSSLLNAIQPGLGLKVGEVGRKGVHPGRHTTTFAQLLKLDAGGFVVDTPGVRAFGLWGIFAEDLPHCFPEFAPHLGQCSFADCTHIHEPNCAVQVALAEGEITESRYKSYLDLRADLPRREAPPE